MVEKTWGVGTGLSSAMGQALMRTLDPSWRMLGISRQADRETTSNVQWVRGDLADREERWIANLLKAITARQIVQLMGVVHAAGVVFADDMQRTTRDEIRRTLDINLAAAFRLLQVVRPWLAPGASVVLVSSVDALMQSEDGPAAIYGAAKAGLVGMARQLAAEWGSLGIRVNVVLPGALSSGMGPNDEVGERIKSRIALGRLGEPSEVAQVISFLLGSQSAYVTGAAIPVDGGLNLHY